MKMVYVIVVILYCMINNESAQFEQAFLIKKDDPIFDHLNGQKYNKILYIYTKTQV